MRFRATFRNETGGLRQVEFNCAYDTAVIVKREAMRLRNRGESLRGEIVRIDAGEIETFAAPHHHPDYIPSSGLKEYYGRTDRGDLIGPYDTVGERDHELELANREIAEEDECDLLVKLAREIDPDAMRRDISGPGKFQGIADADRTLALALSTLVSHDMQDHIFEDGACRVENWIIGNDANGFVWIGRQGDLDEYSKDVEQ